MAYNEQIEARITKIVSRWKSIEAKNMFGGVCHLLHGIMFCGVHKNFLILRLGHQRAFQALKEPYVKSFDITGKPMKGWVMVEEKGFKSDEKLREWLHQARDFVRALPSK
ncbi:MAG: TfoX/Sxy family protein [Gemmatimonadota bacterium]|nr:MAG: TfoX/Sxy family protein [Gemmatimonadota bacterium]